MKPRSGEKVAEQKRISMELGVEYDTVGTWLKQFSENNNNPLFLSRGRPDKTASFSDMVLSLKNRTERQQSLRTADLPSFLQSSAKDTARKRGKPSHTVTLSSRTVRRKRTRLLTQAGVANRKGQFKPDARVVSENSARNMICNFATGVSVSRDVHPALVFNTDKTQFCYNFSPGTRLSLSCTCDAMIHCRGDVMFCRDATVKPNSLRRTAATHSGSKQTRHMPQRLFATVSMNALGACGPMIFQKPIDGLGVDYIAQVNFRDISITPASPSAQQAQLWLYDPSFVSAREVWFKYFSQVPNWWLCS